MKLVPLALSFLLTGSLFAQTIFTDPANLRGERVKPRDGRELPIDGGQGNTALGLQQLLRRLNTRASILNIVAHPDDEDGGMLTFYSRGLGARVADLSLTRGEGGQNAMTGDFEDALGLLRTQELLANDRYTGVDQLFGTEVDFGFSKTKSEAFAKWTHDRVLYDAVRAIRLVRPMVITSSWSGNVTDGHGQHQASGQIAQEAFVAAADPTVFPDMIAEGILPWQALRVYARVPQGAISGKGLYDYATNQYVPATFTNYVTGEVSTTVPSADVVVHEGTTDPILTLAAANPTDLQTLSTGDWQPGAVIKTPPAANSNGLPSPTTSLSYLQFARIGLSLQKSQIGPSFRIPPPGTFDVAYHLYGSAHTQSAAVSASDFFAGIDTSVAGIATLSASLPQSLHKQLLLLQEKLAYAQQTFQADPSPGKIAPQLADDLHETDQLLSNIQSSDLPKLEKANMIHELRIKRVQLNDALALSLGVTLDATTSGTNQTAGTGVVVLSKLATTFSSSSLTITQEWLQNANASADPPPTLTKQDWQAQAAQAYSGSGNNVPDVPGHETIPDLTSERPISRSIHVRPRDTAVLTRPYFFRDSIETPVYTLRTPDLRNAPASPSALTLNAMLDFRGVAIQLSRVVHDGSQPLSFIAPFSLALSTHAQIAPLSQSNVSLTAHLTPATEPEHPTKLPVLLSSQGVRPQTGITAVPGTFEFHVKTPGPNSGISTYDATLTLNGQKYTEGYRPIGYGDLPRTNDYTPATTRIVPVDLTLPTRHTIAYLPGTGDAVPEALASINLAPTILTVADLTPTTLAKYDTVILGVRTYSAHPDLHGAPTQALLDYARNGGNVVVQYQTPEFTAADAPYPLSLGSNEKVVDETAPVQLLTPTSPLLTTPNRITPADFDNWIEERGHGFLSTWDPHYTALTETHDPGAPSEHIAPQLPQRGGLITTPLGKGRWTYVAFALYRQLPEAAPGAYRLFLNLLNP